MLAKLLWKRVERRQAIVREPRVLTSRAGRARASQLARTTDFLAICRLWQGSELLPTWGAICGVSARQLACSHHREQRTALGNRPRPAFPCTLSSHGGLAIGQRSKRCSNLSVCRFITCSLAPLLLTPWISRPRRRGCSRALPRALPRAPAATRTRYCCISGAISDGRPVHPPYAGNSQFTH